MLVDRQVQRAVGGIQVAPPPRAVRQAAHADLAEDRHQRPFVTALQVAVALPVATPNIPDPDLPLRAQPQMLLEQPAMQLPGVDQQPVLQLAMREAGRLLARQPVELRVKQLPRTSKPIRRAGLSGEALPDAARSLCNSQVKPTLRQDFINGPIKFARTGVKIGDHAATFRGRRWYQHADLRHPSYASSGPPPRPKNTPHAPKRREIRAPTPRADPQSPADTGIPRSLQGSHPMSMLQP